MHSLDGKNISSSLLVPVHRRVIRTELGAVDPVRSMVTNNSLTVGIKRADTVGIVLFDVTNSVCFLL